MSIFWKFYETYSSAINFSVFKLYKNIYLNTNPFSNYY